MFRHWSKQFVAKHVKHNPRFVEILTYWNYKPKFISTMKNRHSSRNTLRKKESIIVFGIETWLAKITSCALTFFIITIASKKKSFNGSFLYNYFSFCHYLTKPQTFTKTSKIDVLMYLPIMFMFVGNGYKDENITTLSLEPDLVPFNTLGSLIQNKFRITCHGVFT